MGRKQRSYSVEFVNEFLNLYDAGVTEKVIRKTLNISSSAVQRLRVYAKSDRAVPYKTATRYPSNDFSARWGLYSVYKRGAKMRDLEFTIPFEYFNELISSDCVYCGCEGTERKHGSYVFVGNGVDRIDSAKGYTFDNVTTACSACNMMKRTMGPKEYVEHCQRVSDYNA